MKTIEVINPATGKLHKSYPTWPEAELDKALQQVHQTQKIWAATAIKERSKLMKTMAGLLKHRAHELGEIITQEMGKPIKQAIGEVEKCAWVCEYYADNAEKHIQPEHIETGHRKSYRCFKPLGTIFAIMPWNFPFWQVFRFAAPNLMAGNAGVLKHAPNSTGAALAIEQLFLDAGFPKNLFKTLMIDVDLAPAVIHHPTVAGVTLTGSNRAGEHVAAEAGKAMKKVVLELGGSDPYIILDDADLEQAADQVITSRLLNAGQVCIAAKRIILSDKIKDQFIELLLNRAKQYHCGDPMDKNTNMGPLARQDLLDNLADQVNRARQAGAQCLLGGEPIQGNGYFFPPTILVNVTPDNPAFKEELFGPVICIITAKDENHAIELANDTPYGLGAAVFTQDLTKGEHIAADKLEAGTCNVNMLVGSDPRLPFGGIKQSGFGRELSVEGLHEFMNVKTVNIA